MGTEVKVVRIPHCDFCMDEVPVRAAERVSMALYDGKTTTGPWAYMCQVHFDLFGVGLGLGKGQKLVLELTPPSETEVDSTFGLTHSEAKAVLKDVLGDDEDAIEAELEDMGLA